MACFLVPVTEAVVTTAVQYLVHKRELSRASGATAADTASSPIPFSQKLGWLNKLLWGGSALLAFEHVWHGEVVPWFPFLTAAANPEDAQEMLHEMATNGVAMALLVTAVWAAMLVVSAGLSRREAVPAPAK